MAAAAAPANSNPVLYEVKARAMSNQMEMLSERRMSIDQMLHLSTNDSHQANEADDNCEPQTLAFYKPTIMTSGNFSNLPTAASAIEVLAADGADS